MCTCSVKIAAIKCRTPFQRMRTQTFPKRSPQTARSPWSVQGGFAGRRGPLSLFTDAPPAVAPHDGSALFIRRSP
ncbi:unnamed protein product [Durusdinium trenchii]|uniref:Uncharacterized protein n=1 Tax=Durusdinium trenchii TaxID=1381693 RepID=A0ABP0K7G0_9DINO